MNTNTGFVMHSGWERSKELDCSRPATMLAAILATLAAHAAGAATFHVATTGIDAQPGTKAQPFASVERAVEAARGSPDVAASGSACRPRCGGLRNPR